MSASSVPPHMTPAFARTYEATASRIMAPISFAALDRLRPLTQGMRILDIGAGSGAFSIPAAHAGATVTAIDIAPGMIELLSERLTPFPDAEAITMDGQSLSFADGSFDASVSVMGVSLFQDWRRGLAEQVRVLRAGGKVVLATWRTPPGGGPFVVMAEAMRAAFPDRPPPPMPEGFLHLSDPDRMSIAFHEAGLQDVRTEVIEAVWEGSAGLAYLAEVSNLHAYMPGYAALEPSERARVDEAILSVVDAKAVDDRITLKTSVVLGTGTNG